MSSLVTSAMRSVAGKITRSGLETRTSRPSATTVASVPGMRQACRTGLLCDLDRDRPRGGAARTVGGHDAERVAAGLELLGELERDRLGAAESTELALADDAAARLQRGGDARDLARDGDA